MQKTRCVSEIPYISTAECFKKDGSSIRKRLLPSAIKKCNKELQNVSKELSLSEIKKSLQKLLNTQQKKLSSLTRSCSLPTFTANKDITNLTKYELSQEESDLHKAGLYTFQSNQIKFENQKSSLPLKRFIVCLLTTLNPRKLKVRYKHISRILLILIPTTTNLLHVYYLNIASYKTLEKKRYSYNEDQ